MKISRLLVAIFATVSLVACDGKSVDNKLEGATWNGFPTSFGGFPSPGALWGDHVMYGMNGTTSTSERIFFDTNGNPIDKADVADAVPFGLDFRFIEKSRDDNPWIAVFPSDPSAPVMYYQHGYELSISETQMRDFFGAEDNEEISIVSWNKAHLLVSLQSDGFDTIRQKKGVYYYASRLVLVEDIPVSGDGYVDPIRCVARGGYGEIVRSRVDVDTDRLYFERTLTGEERGIRSAHYDWVDSTGYEEAEADTVDCVTDPFEGELIVVNGGGLVFNLDDDMHRRDIQRVGEFKFSWGGSTSAYWNYDVVGLQFHDETVYEIGKFHEMGILHMSYDAGTGEVCWMSTLYGDLSVRLDCMMLSDAKAAAVSNSLWD